MAVITTKKKGLPLQLVVVRRNCSQGLSEEETARTACQPLRPRPRVKKCKSRIAFFDHLVRPSLHQRKRTIARCPETPVRPATMI